MTVLGFGAFVSVCGALSLKDSTVEVMTFDADANERHGVNLSMCTVYILKVRRLWMSTTTSDRKLRILEGLIHNR